MAARNIDLKAVLARCMEIVDSEKDIILDFIDTDSNIIQPFEEDGGAHTNFMRAQSISAKNHNREMILKFVEEHPDVHMRYMIMPPFELSEKYFILEFEPETVGALIKIGKEAGEEFIGKGEGYTIEKLKEWGLNRDAREQIKHHFEDDE